MPYSTRLRKPNEGKISGTELDQVAQVDLRSGAGLMPHFFKSVWMYWRL